MPQPSKPKPLDNQAILVMSLLALQFGIQPILTKRYTPPTVCKSTVILCQEVVKFALAAFMLHMSGGGKAALDGWSVSTWISVAGIPAALYAIQNISSLLAYQHLDALTFNVLNQTKTLSAALCCYLVMGKSQSRQQIIALFLLLLSALVMERIVTLDWILVLSDSAPKPVKLSLETRHVTHGVAPVLFASFLSGLAGALSQKNLQNMGRNPYLFSMELCAASSLILALSLLISPDGTTIREQGFFGSDWNLQVFIPIVTNAIGGILVGLVTKYAGSVRKGFALIFGILLSGLLQSESVSNEQIVGGILAAVSLWMHATNPPTEPTKLVTSVANGNERPKQE